MNRLLQPLDAVALPLPSLLGSSLGTSAWRCLISSFDPTYYRQVPVVKLQQEILTAIRPADSDREASPCTLRLKALRNPHVRPRVPDNYDGTVS